MTAGRLWQAFAVVRGINRVTCDITLLHGPKAGKGEAFGHSAWLLLSRCSAEMRVSSGYVALCEDGLCAQGFGTIHLSQAFQFHNRALALMDLRQ